MIGVIFKLFFFLKPFTFANTLFCDFRWAFFVSNSSLLGLYAFKSCTVSTQGFGAAADVDEVTAVFFFPEDEEDPDFLDFSGVFLERERVGRAADIWKFGAVSVALGGFNLVCSLGKQHYTLYGATFKLFSLDGRLG